MEPLRYFDCNLQIGRHGYKHPRQIWRTADIVAEMDRCGISGALVYHGMAKSHSPAYGNSLLTEELAGNAGLFGCWVALPDQCGDFMSPHVLAEKMKLNNVRAVKLFPESHKFETDAGTIGPLCAVLERESRPLLIDAQEIGWQPLAGLLERHPDLPVLLQNLAWSEERRLFPLMDRHANLHIEFSALQANEIIEIAYRRFGAERLLFGSGMPFKSPGAARAFIDYARIPEEAKRKLAGGNLSALLGGVEPPPAAAPDQDGITAQACRGLPIEIPVLDSHTHLIEEGGGTGSGWPMLGGDIDRMIALYRTIGIRKMSIAPWVGINGGDATAGNRIAEEARRKYPGEVECFARIDPNYGEDVASEAERWHIGRKFKGMKPYYYNERIKYTDEVYAPWWKLANKLKLYALVDPAIQSNGDYMAQIDELATLYPEVSIFMDHGGRSFEIAEQYAQVANRHRNVSIQLTITKVTLGAIEYLAGAVGADKVLFGTDSPMRDPRPQVGWLAYANLSLTDKMQIFGGNFQRILERCLVR